MKIGYSLKPTMKLLREFKYGETYNHIGSAYLVTDSISNGKINVVDLSDGTIHGVSPDVERHPVSLKVVLDD